MKYDTIWMLGRPGAGKGEQSELLVIKNILEIEGIEKSRFYHLSTGDMFKYLAENQRNPLSKKINEWNSKSALFPDTLVLETMYEFIGLQVKNSNFNPLNQQLIIDGYNRTANQVKIMDTYFDTKASILIDVPIDIALKRVEEREKVKPSLENGTPEGRMKRQNTFDNNIGAVIELLPKETFYRIDGNRPIEQVYTDIASIINKIIK